MRREGLSSRQMKAHSYSLAHLVRDAGDPYENLANAIICVAADDYRKAVLEGDIGTEKEVRRFFRSSLFSLLTNVDPKLFIDLLNRDCARKLEVAYIE